MYLYQKYYFENCCFGKQMPLNKEELYKLFPSMHFPSVHLLPEGENPITNIKSVFDFSLIIALDYPNSQMLR